MNFIVLIAVLVFGSLINNSYYCLIVQTIIKNDSYPDIDVNKIPTEWNDGLLDLQDVNGTKVMASYDSMLEDILQKSVNAYQVKVQEVSNDSGLFWHIKKILLMKFLEICCKKRYICGTLINKCFMLYIKFSLNSNQLLNQHTFENYNCINLHLNY